MRPQIFAKTLQTTDIWLNELCDELGPDRAFAWKVLSTVLHKLRDRMPLALAAHLGAQLPLLVRGAFYDQFEPAKLPMDCGYEEFVSEVDEWLADTRPVDPRDAIVAVFGLLSRHLSPGLVEKVRHGLPRELRRLWYRAEEQPSRRDSSGMPIGWAS